MPERYLMKGNEALAEAAIRAGCTQYFGYPITPQTEISAYLAKELSKCGGTFVQAESELAAVNMVLGAASAGKRAMTSSSSPGISLKSEGLSYLAGSDLPALIVNVQRAGPGLGGIQPAQSDYFQATRAPGHGDFHLLCYAPASVQEMADLTARALDRADQYRVPAMILADGLLGQMMEPVTFQSERGDATSGTEKPWATTGSKGKRKPNVINSLILDAKLLEQMNRERFERYVQIKQQEVLYQTYRTEDARIIVVAFGGTARIAQTAVDLAREQGIAVGLFRPITVWPFPEEALAKLAPCVDAMLSVEMNMGQMVDDVRLAVNGACPVSFFGRTGGIVPRPAEILSAILALT